MFLYEPIDYHLKLLDFILLARMALVAIEDSACGKKTLLYFWVSIYWRGSLFGCHSV